MCGRMSVAVLLLGLCVSVEPLVADDVATTEEKPPPPPIRKIYDVTDLVSDPAVEMGAGAILPPTELTGARPRSQGSRNAPPQQERVSTTSERVDQLAKLIMESIDPTAWRDAGGSEASLRGYQTRLIVIASPENHAKIAELLADLRAVEGRGVRIRATWAALSDEELQSVLAPTPDAATGRARLVDVGKLDGVKGAVRFRAEINCLNGQQVNVMAGRARSVLTSLDAVVGNAAAAMEPTIDLVLSGAMLTVTPVLSGDGKAVTLALRSVAGRWDKADAAPIKVPSPVASSQPATPIVAGPPTEVERVNMPVHVVATVARVPTGVAALIGGITAEGEQGGESRPVYLIVETWGTGK